MLSILNRLRTRGRREEHPAQDERDLIAFVNEARTEAQRHRIVSAARRRAARR